MKKRERLSLAIGIFLSVAISIISVANSVYLCKESNQQYYYVPIMFVLGLLGGYVLHNLFHELGHIIGAKIAGATIYEFNFCNLTFAKGQKPKFAKSNEAGFVSFIPNAPEKSITSLSYSLIGGFLGSFIALIVGIIFYGVGSFNGNYYLISAFGGFIAVAVYLIVLNFFTKRPNSDGRLIATDQKELNQEFYQTLLNLEYQSHMQKGLSADKIEFLVNKRISKSIVFCLFDVQKSLMLGDVAGAEQFVKTQLSLTKTGDNGPIDLLLEELFIDLIKGNQKNVAEHYKCVAGLIDEPMTLQEMRVSIYYKRFIGETDWANALEGTYFKMLDKCPIKGLAKTEEEIYKLYLNL